jgi:hypothetical protein
MTWGARCSSCWPFYAIRPYSARQGSWRRQRVRWTISSSRARAKVSRQRRGLIRYCTPVPWIAANRRCTKLRSLIKHYRKKKRKITFTVNAQEKKAEGTTLIKILWSENLIRPKSMMPLLNIFHHPPLYHLLATRLNPDRTLETLEHEFTSRPASRS